MAPAFRAADPGVAVVEETIGDLLRRVAATAPDAIALVDGVADPAARTRWTYGELLVGAERLAGALAHELHPGERLAVWSANVPESLFLTYAAALAGLVLVPVNPVLRARELTHVLAHSGAAGLVLGAPVGDHDLAATLRSVRADLPDLRTVVPMHEVDDLATSGPRGALPAVHPEDVAQIVYTSGTTGTPKGARLTHRGMTNVARFAARRFGIVAGDIYVDPLPLFHIGGQAVALEIAHPGATLVMMRTFDAALHVVLLEEARATLTVAVPTMLVAILEQSGVADRDLTALRSVSSGGAVVPAELVRRVRRDLGASVTIVFGQTECCGFIAQTHLDDDPGLIEETIGTPLDGIDVRVVDPVSGAVVETGEVGELQVRGYNVMAGYHDQPEETAAAFDDGWLRTGDLVTLDDGGSLRIVGRLKDTIITGAVNVSAAEVEAALTEHPAVAEAAVFGVSDARWGEAVGAAIRACDGESLDIDALRAHLATRLAPYKIPKRWLVVDAMPTTPFGKVQKHVLRARMLAGDTLPG